MCQFCMKRKQMFIVMSYRFMCITMVCLWLCVPNLLLYRTPSSGVSTQSFATSLSRAHSPKSCHSSTLLLASEICGYDFSKNSFLGSDKLSARAHPVSVQYTFCVKHTSSDCLFSPVCVRVLCSAVSLLLFVLHVISFVCISALPATVTFPGHSFHSNAYNTGFWLQWHT